MDFHLVIIPKNLATLLMKLNNPFVSKTLKTGVKTHMGNLINKTKVWGKLNPHADLNIMTILHPILKMK